MDSEITNKGLRIRHRGILPHWEIDEGTYFVTFRLDDSVPNSVVDDYRFERQNIINVAKQMERYLTTHERERLEILYSDRIEKYLDSGAGSCYLKRTEVAEIVKNALYFFNGQRYNLAAWCIMPNHVHVVFRVQGSEDLEKILHSWKSYTSTAANKIIRRKGTFWQREYYDHLVRNKKEFLKMVEYVLDNPRKVGLQDWPWVELCF